MKFEYLLLALVAISSCDSSDPNDPDDLAGAPQEPVLIRSGGIEIGTLADSVVAMALLTLAEAQ